MKRASGFNEIDMLIFYFTESSVNNLFSQSFISLHQLEQQQLITLIKIYKNDKNFKSTESKFVIKLSKEAAISLVIANITIALKNKWDNFHKKREKELTKLKDLFTF